ncbi:hypothetical protein GARC_1575 [Paraglaciecola arctica BSs20135]|uniref:Uncharacterized protein n=1 Tax=Paraglaciecola arctica BSs20135 TaxID=493475 RepID=K6YK32_9ALTE|nr:hypothetical protein GARC_1575 [Paraglaciecola arctica BSs20135]
MYTPQASIAEIDLFLGLDFEVNQMQKSEHDSAIISKGETWKCK